MKTPRDPHVTIAAWLDDGPTSLPPITRQVVVSSIHLTPQRRDRLGWIPWRFPNMNSAFRAAAAAVIGVLLLGGAYYLFGGGGGPDIGAPATPTQTSSPRPLPPAGALEPGTYVTDGDWADPTVGLPVSFTLPDGWGNAGWAIETPPGATYTGVTADDQIWISLWTVANVPTDPCRGVTTMPDPPVGPSVDDFVSAMRAQVGSNATAPDPVSIDGRAGQVLEYEIPADLDAATCERGEYDLWTAGGDGTRTAGSFRGLRGRLWVVDVEDLAGGQPVRLVIEATLPAEASPSQWAKAEAIVDSFRLGPAGPEPTPGTTP
jgi:hypothetical protein